MFRGSRVVLEMVSLFRVEIISLRFIQRESRGFLIYLRNQGQGSRIMEF